MASGNSTSVAGNAKRKRTSWLTPNAFKVAPAPTRLLINAANGAVGARGAGPMNWLDPITASADVITALRARQPWGRVCEMESGIGERAGFAAHRRRGQP